MCRLGETINNLAPAFTLAGAFIGCGILAAVDKSENLSLFRQAVNVRGGAAANSFRQRNSSGGSAPTSQTQLRFDLHTGSFIPNSLAISGQQAPGGGGSGARSHQRDTSVSKRESM